MHFSLEMDWIGAGCAHGEEDEDIFRSSAYEHRDTCSNVRLRRMCPYAFLFRGSGYARTGADTG